MDEDLTLWLKDHYTEIEATKEGKVLYNIITDTVQLIIKSSAASA